MCVSLQLAVSVFPAAVKLSVFPCHVRFSCADGLYLDDDTEVLRSALGRSQSTVMPVLMVEGAKHSFKVVIHSYKCLV